MWPFRDSQTTETLPRPVSRQDQTLVEIGDLLAGVGQMWSDTTNGEHLFALGQGLLQIGRRGSPYSHDGEEIQRILNFYLLGESGVCVSSIVRCAKLILVPELNMNTQSQPADHWMVACRRTPGDPKFLHERIAALEEEKRGLEQRCEGLKALLDAMS